MPLLYQRWPRLDRAMARVTQGQDDTQRALRRLLTYVLEHPTEDQEGLEIVWVQGEGGLEILRAYLALRGAYHLTDKILQEFLAQCARGERAQVQQGSVTLWLSAGRIRVSSG